MKITSIYRGKETELCNDCVVSGLSVNGIKIKQRRHYNGNEKFYEIELNKMDIESMRYLFIPRNSKSTLVKLAEKIDSIINTLKERLR